MADGIGTENKGADAVPHEDGRPAYGSSHGMSGQYGVSDKRRAELAQMERDAGTAHDAGTADERSQSDRTGSERDLNPTSAEQVGNETEPTNTQENPY